MMRTLITKKETCVILCHILIFILAMMLPMNWTNKERLWHGFFWSMDEAHDFNLHTGFNSDDWIKPFYDDYVEGMFRTRQLSYYAEMISFKLWQLSGHVFIKDYSLVGLHLLNVVLLFFLILKLAEDRRAALFGALLFLNSGAALATLLYPFRNAKILAMTFFLLSWLILATHKGPLARISWLKLSGLFFIVLGGLFTDEISFFLFPLLIIYLVLRDGKKGVLNGRVLSFVVLCLSIWFVLLKIILAVSIQVDPSSSGLTLQHTFLKLLRDYYIHPFMVFKDTIYAFVAYFLRRDFGYWDWTLCGQLAALASAILLLAAVTGRHPKFEKRMALAVLVIFFIKAVLLPHNSGYHHIFMPEGTYFPSLLFFSYYYVYCEALLIGLVLVLLIKPHLNSTKKYLGLLILLLLISFSNFIHLTKGPKDALLFMNYANEHRQNRIRDIKAIAKIISNENYQPVYLSFPAGNYQTIKGRQGDAPELSLYQRMIPVKYLRAIEQKKAIVSYKNAMPLDPFLAPYELSSAKYFYDVYKQEIFDLAKIRESYSLSDMVPKNIKPNMGTVFPLNGEDKDPEQLIIFIKGTAAMLLQGSKSRWSATQYYGNAYQKFEFDLKELNIRSFDEVVLKVKALESPGGIEIVGPFIIKNDPGTVELNQKKKDRQKKSDILIQYGFQQMQHSRSIEDVARGLYYLKQAIQENSLNLSAYVALGEAYMQVASYQDAIDVLRGALIVFPQNPKIHYLLGVCHKMNKEILLAVYHMRRSAQIYESRHDIQNALRSKDLLVQYLDISKQ